ncbi:MULTISPECIES: EF-hand domain-containing protein [unclassified Nostoc]|uniref:EF-hand domain-containing protein n=1 Tax=unclassified Nostoc TaxID=2593658 RepID=UPI002AD3579E|nr:MULTISPECIES: EF-hand domain-containing protein [unclassified Nostoc]MDZ8121598.1 EF-hand domain-containing protein [Nostoc sp. CmiVER01]MDZ8227232.1 EF-hand domain-containing protein [Nostoc sp. ChiVER01]
MATEQELQSLFNKLDTDQDGKISLNDLFLSPGLSTVISSETNISTPQELIVNYDSDEDGSITFEELKSAVEKANNLT